MTEHPQKHDQTYMVGTYVNTLSMHVDPRTFEGASSHPIRVEASNFTAKEALWCYSLGSGFVVCRGVVVGTIPTLRSPDCELRARIGKLPVELRPKANLQFAALSREVYDVGGHTTYSSHLVTLLVSTDGWIRVFSNREAESAVDLSALRFCFAPGISLVDEVSVHTVDLAGGRMVSLQGSLSCRSFKERGRLPLALLPDSCRPPQELMFVGTGDSLGGFNLVLVRPAYHPIGVGGELFWRDSVWNRDTIHVTGTMYEVADDALTLSTLAAKWSPVALQALLSDFQTLLMKKFGAIDTAWYSLFDLYGAGSVTFTNFGLGCKSIGYIGNITKLWAGLDLDCSGAIDFGEFLARMESAAKAPNVLVTEFAESEQRRASVE